MPAAGTAEEEGTITIARRNVIKTVLAGVAGPALHRGASAVAAEAAPEPPPDCSLTLFVDDHDGTQALARVVLTGGEVTIDHPYGGDTGLRPTDRIDPATVDQLRRFLLIARG